MPDEFVQPGAVSFTPPTVPLAPPPRELRPWGPWATIGWSLLAAVVATAVTLAVGVVIGIALVIVGELSGDKPDATIDAHMGMVELIGYVAMMAAALAFLWIPTWLRGYRYADYLAFVRVAPKQHAIALGAILAFLAVEETVIYLLGRPIPQSMIDVWETCGSVTLLVVVIVVVAPIAEEMFFRGFLQRGLALTRFGALPAIVATSLAWAVIHVQYEWPEMVIIFLMGLLLGWVRHRTGSITPCILMHMTVNGISTVLFVLMYE